MTKIDGFTAFGVFYKMGKPVIPYIEQIQIILKEIRNNALKSKNEQR